MSVNTRATGAVYLLYFVTAIGGQSLTVHGFGGAGLIVSLIAAALYVAVTILFYFMFKPVNMRVSLLAAIISLAGCAITVLNLFRIANQVSPLVFFGPYCLLLGYLILKSPFLSRILGVLLVLAGFGWLVFLALPPTSVFVRYIEGLGILAEGLFMLWLLVFGETSRRRRQDEPHVVRATK